MPRTPNDDWFYEEDAVFFFVASIHRTIFCHGIISYLYLVGQSTDDPSETQAGHAQKAAQNEQSIRERKIGRVAETAKKFEDHARKYAAMKSTPSTGPVSPSAATLRSTRTRG
jgi:hypothetical protein